MLRKVIAMAASLLLLASLGCHTKNVGGDLPLRGPLIEELTVPTGLFAQNDGDFSVSWSGGQAPFSISWDFGGGAKPNTIGPQPATSPDNQTVLFTNNTGSTTLVSVSVTDANGESDSASASYTYGTGGGNHIVLAVSGGDGTSSVTVHGNDMAGNDITVTATPPSGTTVDLAQQVIQGGSGDVTFDFSALDFFGGASGVASFVADDSLGHESNTVSANVVVPGPVLAADTLYAIPLQGSAAVGEPVRIVVATGVPANPFQFMNGCRVTAPNGFEYVNNSFNIGAPGGQAGDVDGFWSGMNPGGGFLSLDNFFSSNGENSAGPGRDSIDFQVTPLGGSDRTTDSGALFNFEATFAAGVNRLGFQDVQGVSRTYYSDSNTAPDRFWGDITNNHAGIPNSVTVE